LPEVVTEEAVVDGKPRKIRKGSTITWQIDGTNQIWRERGINAIAVAGQDLMLAVSHTNKDMDRTNPYRLHRRSMADGRLLQELPLRAQPVTAGVSCDDGIVLVVTDDGAVTAFGK
jgi:hypothetical protein